MIRVHILLSVQHFERKNEKFLLKMPKTQNKIPKESRVADFGVENGPFVVFKTSRSEVFKCRYCNKIIYYFVYKASLYFFESLKNIKN